MALSAADLVIIYTDQIRGLESDLVRAEVLAAADDYQAQRLEIIKKQIEVATAKLAEATAAADTEDNERLSAFVAANAPADGWPDDYEKQTKSDLATLLTQRGIEGPNPKDTKPVIIDRLRAWDLHHVGAAVEAGVTPGT